MNTDLSTLSDPELSAVFATEVAGWTGLVGRNGEEPGWPGYRKPVPQFASSVDALLPWLDGAKDQYPVEIVSTQTWLNAFSWSVQIMHAKAVNKSLPRAVCEALVLWKRGIK